MAAVLQICIDPENASPTEIVATFSGEELNAAAGETSNTYNGLVLARALVIVQTRTRCFSLQEFGERLGVGKSAVYRWAKGKPVSPSCYQRALHLLAMELFERGQR